MDLDVIFKKFPVIAVDLFGSRAKEGGKIDSDYDFAILLSQGIPYSQLPAYKFSPLKELTRQVKNPVDVPGRSPFVIKV